MAAKVVQGQEVEADSDLSVEVPMEQRIAEELLERARAGGVKLVGPGGVLAGVTRRILESALEMEMAEHLGYDKGDPAGSGAPNSRNGYSAKTVHTDVGPIALKIPRDRRGEFEPQIIRKHAVGSVASTR